MHQCNEQSSCSHSAKMLMAINSFTIVFLPLFFHLNLLNESLNGSLVIFPSYLNIYDNSNAITVIQQSVNGKSKLVNLAYNCKKPSSNSSMNENIIGLKASLRELRVFLKRNSFKQYSRQMDLFMRACK